MRVIDSSALIELLVGAAEPHRLGEEPLVAPHLIDSEVLQTLRRLERTGVISAAKATRTVERLGRLLLTRFPTDRLQSRIWELRHNLTAYDATYVALAEALDATCLLTSDERLGRASGVRCSIELI